MSGLQWKLQLETTSLPKKKADINDEVGLTISEGVERTITIGIVVIHLNAYKLNLQGKVMTAKQLDSYQVSSNSAL